MVKVHSLHPLSCWEVYPMQHALHEHVLKADFYKQRLAVLDIPVLVGTAMSPTGPECGSGPCPPLQGTTPNVLIFSYLAGAFMKNPLWSLLFSRTGYLDRISLLADFKSRGTFLAADVKEILVECVQGLEPQTCFDFIEKEQSKETWPVASISVAHNRGALSPVVEACFKDFNQRTQEDY